MKKLLAILLLCVLVLGCSKGETDEEGNLINCEKCDDGDECTTDICARDGSCENVPIKRCCGDDLCEDGETCLSCEEDCGKCYTLTQLQKDANKVYGRHVAFTNNKIVAKPYGEIVSPDYDFYDSTYLTIIEIKDKEDYISDYKDFKAFIEKISADKYEDLKLQVAEDYPSDEYEFDANYTLIYSNTLVGELITYNYWVKMYKLYVSNPGNMKIESYVVTELTDPILDSTTYFMCTPKLVLGVRSNQPQMLEKFWVNLNEEEYQKQIHSWLRMQAKGALDEATRFQNYCSGN